MLSNKNDRRLLYAMFANAGIKEKEIQQAIIAQFTDGETTSSKEMSQDQIYKCRQALAKELGNTPQDNMRKKMIHYGHLMGWKHMEGIDCGKIDIARLDNWCITYGQYHKALNQHNYDELVKLVTQFKKVYVSYVKNL